MQEKVKNRADASGAKRLARIALFTALTAVCAQISIPLPGGVPITLQTLAVMLAAIVLRFDGVIAVAAYIVLGLVGVPVFSKFGATASLVSPTGGYIVGFLPMAALMAAVCEFADRKKRAAERLADAQNNADEKSRKEQKRREARRTIIVSFIAAVLGTLVCYVFGTAWFIELYSLKGTEKTVSAVLSACVLPFIAPDLLKIALASYLALLFSRVR
ncbi:MAG: biotin transporter BioY [Candidatus Scatosoma sp.]